MDRKKKIVDMTNEELIAVGFLGPDAPADIIHIVESIKDSPTYLGSIDCGTVDIARRQSLGSDGTTDRSVFSPAAENRFSQLNANSNAYTVVAPNLLSEYEMTFYYHGISSNPPKLMWRSDFESNPFPTPPAGVRFWKIPTKSPQGVFNTPLNRVWDTVAPQIIQSIKARGLRFSALMTTRFLIDEDDKEERLGPVVIWIAVHPNTTDAAGVRDATPDILGILAREKITDVVVEWYEGSVTRLVDCAPAAAAESTTPSTLA